MANVEHKDITDPNIHETKGASTALVGQVLTANGDGTSTFQNPAVYSEVDIGWYNVSDTATTGSPIALSVAGTFYDLTNNASGTDTSNTYGVAGISSVWNTGTSRFDFSGLALGDLVNISVDVSYTTTTANTALDMIVELGVGQPGVYNIPLVVGQNIKTSSTARIVAQKLITMKNTTTKDFPARIRVKADQTGSTIVVNNFVVEVIKRG